MMGVGRDKYTIPNLLKSIQRGTYASDYRINDVFPIKLQGFDPLEMEIVAFDSDMLADESGNAPVTLVSKTLLGPTKYQWNTQGLNAGGYPLCSLRTVLNETIAPLVENAVGNGHLAEVKKSSYGPANIVDPTDDDPRSTLWSNDYVWIISAREYGYGLRENSGPIYAGMAKPAFGERYHIRSTFVRKNSNLDLILESGAYGTDYGATVRFYKQRIGFCLK